MRFPRAMQRRILDHLSFLYGQETGGAVWKELRQSLKDFVRRNPHLTMEAAPDSLTEGDSVLITYGDQFREEGSPPLETLRCILVEMLGKPVTSVHILPFFPYSSDDGFSVIDYTQVDPELGTWRHIEELGADFRLMFDAVINHVSRESDWFKAFLSGDPEYAAWFITVEPGVDLSQVVRPRALPLLTEVETPSGRKLVWTTFSSDQIDLNYANPATLLRIIDTLLFYVEKGAQLIRLDAIAYMWKKAGTKSIHLEETHRVIKLFRAVLDIVAPSVLLITETNVPHEENISYFGVPLEDSGRTDEAQLVYQFPLAPLIMHSILAGDARVLSRWAAGLEVPSPQATFFNFTASHDGIGVTPAQGLLSKVEMEKLVEATLQHGGYVSYRDNPDGSQSVYELNISYFDALSNPDSDESTDVQVDRFIASQAIMLALKGVPGIYVHSLLGSRSWREGVAQTGRNRTVNRQKLQKIGLEGELANPDSLRHRVFAAYRRLLDARSSQAAFHPGGDQRVLDFGDGVFAILRTSPGRDSQVLCAHNVTGESVTIHVAPEELGLDPGAWRDLLSREALRVPQEGLSLSIDAYGVRWVKV